MDLSTMYIRTSSSLMSSWIEYCGVNILAPVGRKEIRGLSGKRAEGENNKCKRERDRINSRKSGSLCPTSFIEVESHISLVEIGQWPVGDENRYK